MNLDIDTRRAADAVIRSSEDAMFVIDRKRRIRAWNPGAERLFGYSAEGIIGQPLDILIPAEREAERDYFERAVHGETVRGIETVRLDNKGAEIEVALSLFPVYGDQGKVTCVAEILHDITTAQAQMLELERRRRIEIAEQLAHGVAHDFYHILGIIKNYSKFILKDVDGGDSSRIPEDYKAIQDAVDQGEKLARALMQFSQSQTPAPQIFSLNEAVENVKELLHSFSAVEIKYDLDPDLWMIKADRGQIEQVILNLALNARDAMGEGGGKITIRTYNISHPVSEVEDFSPRQQLGDIPSYPYPFFACLVVSDTGNGILPEHLEHIFDPFFTTKTSNRNGAAGLGLASVYGIVETAGGSISIDSEVGKGTTFTIRLPGGMGASVPTLRDGQREDRSYQRSDPVSATGSAHPHRPSEPL